MENKKVLLVFILGILLLGSISAITYGKQYTDINIIETCSVNGFVCPEDFLCNITITDPDENLIVLNEPMTRNDTVYNYTLILTDTLGGYPYSVDCDNVTQSGREEKVLEVTTTGREPLVKTTIFLTIVAFLLFVLALYMKNHAMGFVSGILFLMAGVYFMIYGLENVADMYTRAIAVTLIAFGGFVTVVAGYEWLDDLE